MVGGAEAEVGMEKGEGMGSMTSDEAGMMQGQSLGLLLQCGTGGAITLNRGTGDSVGNKDGTDVG